MLDPNTSLSSHQFSIVYDNFCLYTEEITDVKAINISLCGQTPECTMHFKSGVGGKPKNSMNSRRHSR